MQEYKIKYYENGIVKTKTLRSDNIKKCKLPQNVIEIKQNGKKLLNFNFKSKIKIEQSELIEIFYELSLMLEANLIISDAMDILIENQTNSKTKAFIKDLKNSFVNLSSVDKLLDTYKIDENITSFLKLSQNSSNLKRNIKSLYMMLNESYQVKKDFKKALRYPMMLVVTMCLSLNMIFYFVIPKFKAVFSDSYNSLPQATKLLFFIQEFYFENIFYIFLFFIFTSFIFTFLYISVYKFRYFIQKVLVKKVLLFRELYLYTQLYKVFLVLDIFVNSSYEFPKALGESKALVKNKYILDKISLIENYIKNGKTISFSFKKANLFDTLILSLLRTAEVSNSMKVVLPEIKMIYKNRVNEKINKILTYIEPIFLFIIVGIILWIVLAIFIPIWDMGNIIKS
ncbi:MAG: type II secretion system F family protein [Campylobacterota bacterium]